LIHKTGDLMKSPKRAVRKFAAAALCTAFCSTTAWAQTIELAGVKYTGTTKVADSTLQLNGAGIRHKFVVKVYTAGLYLSNKASTSEAVLAASGAKRIHVVMLRDIDGNDLGRLFTRGMQDNTPRDEMSKHIAGTLRLADIFAVRKKLQAGDVFDVDYVPGTGTTVSINGKPQAEAIKEPEFFNALLRIWLGNSPADRLLKDALLGKPPAAGNDGTSGD
jgi:Chalcone isomerase-like